MDRNMTSEGAPMYGTLEYRAHPSQERYPLLGSPAVKKRSFLNRRLALQTNSEPANPSDHEFGTRPTSGPFFGDTKAQLSLKIPFGVCSTVLYSSPAIITTGNAQMTQYESTTIVPLDTRFNVDHRSPDFETTPSDHHMHYVVSSNHTRLRGNIDPSRKHRDASSKYILKSHSPTLSQVQVRRGRGLECAEPGSARAIYLEKNRKAASKCRSKQKRRQEELVETARDVERKNEMLKAEVEMLKRRMWYLMELVGQHTDCTDARLDRYLQREADRLAAISQ